MAKSKGFQFSFEHWIVKFRKEKSEKGTLARIVFNNYTFRKGMNQKTVKKYLKDNSASYNVMKMLDNIWPEFEEFKAQQKQEMCVY